MFPKGAAVHAGRFHHLELISMLESRALVKKSPVSWWTTFRAALLLTNHEALTAKY